MEMILYSAVAAYVIWCLVYYCLLGNDKREDIGPCPFCGHSKCTMDDDLPGYRISCDKCHGNLGGGWDKESVISRWNKEPRWEMRKR
jgi:hypothetical protein